MAVARSRVRHFPVVSPTGLAESSSLLLRTGYSPQVALHRFLLKTAVTIVGFRAVTRSVAPPTDGQRTIIPNCEFLLKNRYHASDKSMRQT